MHFVRFLWTLHLLLTHCCNKIFSVAMIYNTNMIKPNHFNKQWFCPVPGSPFTLLYLYLPSDINSINIRRNKTVELLTKAKNLSKLFLHLHHIEVRRSNLLRTSPAIYFLVCDIFVVDRESFYMLFSSKIMPSYKFFRC